MPREIFREKLFFAIYTDTEKIFHHLIVYRTSKKALREELKGQGHTVKAVFSDKDVEMILSEEFMDTTVSEKTIAYLKANIDEWNRSQ
ncbi:MAG: hypothetical protein R3Y63_15605 [Eubacteriales bacterium]